MDVMKLPASEAMKLCLQQSLELGELIAPLTELSLFVPENVKPKMLQVLTGINNINERNLKIAAAILNEHS